MQICTDTLACQHPITQFFTGRMPFLSPNQQRQSTEGCTTKLMNSRFIYCIDTRKEKGKENVKTEPM